MYATTPTPIVASIADGVGIVDPRNSTSQ